MNSTGAPPTVLNVDDNEARRYAKSRILKQGGYQVIESETGADALRVIKELKPSLVLLDIKLPDTTGFAVCEAIKSDPATAHIMVLQVSAMYLTPEDRAIALERGADTYLTEPIEAAELLGTIKALLRLYDRDREKSSLLEQLREADKRKDEFLAVLGHEWRNPLGVISNAFALLPASDTPESHEIRTIIKRQLSRMTRLTDDLLDVSRISGGQIEIDKQSCNFAAIVREAAEDYRGIFDSIGIRLELHLPSDPVWVLGDSMRLAQCAGNLLHNANKFTQPGGTVSVSLQIISNQQLAVLTVRDTGIGMDQSTLTRVFEPFSQGLRTFNRSRGGLGLGLALVKGFIEVHGGEVSASSKGPGTGSEFTVQLPVRKHPRGASDARS